MLQQQQRCVAIKVPLAARRGLLNLGGAAHAKKGNATEALFHFFRRCSSHFIRVVRY